LGAVVVVVGSVVEVEDVVVVVESAVATGAATKADPTPMITARLSERRIKATYFAPRSPPRRGFRRVAYADSADLSRA